MREPSDAEINAQVAKMPLSLLPKLKVDDLREIAKSIWQAEQLAVEESAAIEEEKRYQYFSDYYHLDWHKALCYLQNARRCLVEGLVPWIKKWSADERGTTYRLVESIPTGGWIGAGVRLLTRLEDRRDPYQRLDLTRKQDYNFFGMALRIHDACGTREYSVGFDSPLELIGEMANNDLLDSLRELFLATLKQPYAHEKPEASAAT